MKLLVCIFALCFAKAESLGGLFSINNEDYVKQKEEAILFAINTTGAVSHVTMYAQINYAGPAESFSWILPVPNTPSKISIGTTVLFQRLSELLRPTFQFRVEEEQSQDCNPDQFARLNEYIEPRECSERQDPASGSPGLVLEGSVGPFDYVIIQAMHSDPVPVINWLSENGYYIPDGADALLNFYAIQGQQFMAMRLRKESSSGDIQPIVVQYELPPDDGQSNVDPDTQIPRRALANMPIQLTSIAADNSVPMHVYVLGSFRATPLNYLEIQFDGSQVAWEPNVDDKRSLYRKSDRYEKEYLRRFTQATNDIGAHSFVTEYAGSTEVLTDAIAHSDFEAGILQRGFQTLQQTTGPEEFLKVLPRSNIPYLVHLEEVMEKYIPLGFSEDAPSFCRENGAVYRHAYKASEYDISECFLNYSPDENWAWDPVGLTEEMEDVIVGPIREAQQLVDRHPYLTSLYTRLTNTDLSKDPFFAMKPDLPEVSNIHSAFAIPQCDDNFNAYALDIEIEGMNNSYIVPAQQVPDCEGGFRYALDRQGEASPVLKVASWGFAGDEGVVVRRSADGTFDLEAVQRAIAFGDSLVIDQTIPDYAAPESPSTAQVTVSLPVPVDQETTNELSFQEVGTTQPSSLSEEIFTSQPSPSSSEAFTITPTMEPPKTPAPSSAASSSTDFLLDQDTIIISQPSFSPVDTSATQPTQSPTNFAATTPAPSIVSSSSTDFLLELNNFV